MQNSANILLADDDEIYLQQTASQLGRAGFSCTLCRSAAQVLEAVRTIQADLLISDINMPGNANLELVRALQEAAPGLPVILVTAFPTLDTALVSANSAVAAYLVKPLNFPELIELVRTLIPRAHMARSLTETRKHLEDWQNELDQMIAMLSQPRGREYQMLADAFVKLAIKNITTSLRDIQSVTETLSTGQPAEIVCRDMNCPRLVQLDGALRETIRVLQETKGSFKSSELGALRRKLETLVP
jgi:DNA-binding NtrC family response regulator